jgi:hypothetical protein
MITTGILTYPTLVSQIANFERTEPFSVETWLFYPNDRTTQGGIACRLDATIPEYRGWLFYIGLRSMLGFALINDDKGSNFLHVRTAINMFTFGTWNHLVVTYNGTSLASGVKFYVNNVVKPHSIVRDTLTGTTLNNAPFTSGYSLVTSYIKARLDELTIYNRTLSAAEVSQRYNAGAGTETLFGPAYLQYHLNESSGTAVADSSGNSRHAITQNDPTWMTGKLNNCLNFNGVNQTLIGIE